MLSVYLFEFRITALEQLELQGPNFRGAIGAALKDLLCTEELADCSRCPIVKECAFTKIWVGTERNKTASPESGHFKNQESLPRPFVLHVPQQTLEPGEQGLFRLGLFGSAITFLPHFIGACALLAGTGLSRKRKRFHLDTVLSIDPEGNKTAITVFEKNSTRTSDTFHSVSFDASQSIALANAPPAANRIRVTFDTPTQISAGERILDRAPTFAEVARALFRRYTDLSELYGKGRPQLSFDSIICGASKVSLADANISTQKSKTFSRRKNSPTPVQGITGWIEFEGDLESFMPLLTFGQWMHIGKQTTFGLGHYSTEILSSP